jgi:hypothetical protein
MQGLTLFSMTKSLDFLQQNKKSRSFIL